MANSVNSDQEQPDLALHCTDLSLTIYGTQVSYNAVNYGYQAKWGPINSAINGALHLFFKTKPETKLINFVNGVEFVCLHN